ncbi:MAG: hypothetical protein SW833_28145 [Cyanobacteriota bacterium]|nr:hypothetical protein [Cyanobacteriota bacterium]
MTRCPRPGNFAEVPKCRPPPRLRSATIQGFHIMEPCSTLVASRSAIATAFAVRSKT